MLCHCDVHDQCCFAHVVLHANLSKCSVTTCQCATYVRLHQCVTLVRTHQYVTFVTFPQCVTFARTHQCVTFVGSHQCVTYVRFHQCVTYVRFHQCVTFVGTHQCVTYVTFHQCVTYFSDLHPITARRTPQNGNLRQHTIKPQPKNPQKWIPHPQNRGEAPVPNGKLDPGGSQCS